MLMKKLICNRSLFSSISLARFKTPWIKIRPHAPRVYMVHLANRIKEIRMLTFGFIHPGFLYHLKYKEIQRIINYK